MAEFVRSLSGFSTVRERLSVALEGSFLQFPNDQAGGQQPFCRHRIVGNADWQETCLVGVGGNAVVGGVLAFPEVKAGDGDAFLVTEGVDGKFRLCVTVQPSGLSQPCAAGWAGTIVLQGNHEEPPKDGATSDGNQSVKDVIHLARTSETQQHQRTHESVE